MGNTIFSLKTLAWCWAGLLATVGSGAVALQLTTPPPAFVAVATIAPAPKPVVSPPSTSPAVPFQNRSLLALLPPPVEHPVERVRERSAERPMRVAAALPVPPLPPGPRILHGEQRRIVTAYVAEPAYAATPPWGRMAPYAAEYARLRPYAYAAPPTYYGW